jgi:hypothetical protein
MELEAGSTLYAVRRSPARPLSAYLAGAVGVNLITAGLKGGTRVKWCYAASQDELSGRSENAHKIHAADTGAKQSRHDEAG